MNEENTMCELCSRYGWITETDGSIKRTFDAENNPDVQEEFYVCASCASELDAQAQISKLDLHRKDAM